MAECLTCKKALQGSWNMTVCQGFEKTGRYLGITDGYFLYAGSAHWVYCYCGSCWQNEVLKLSFVSSKQQFDTLQQQNASLQQQLNTLQQQLDTSRVESISYKKQIDEMTERYDKLLNNSGINTSGIEKLRDLFKQLSFSQIDTLHKHTNFRLDTFETMHETQQIQCSSEFVQSSLQQFRASVDTVIQLQKSILAQRKQAKESVFQTLTTAGVPTTIIDAAIKLLQTEIEQIEVDIEGWNTFSTTLIDVLNKSTSVCPESQSISEQKHVL